VLTRPKAAKSREESCARDGEIAPPITSLETLTST
jgi:hypothetical protein